MPKKQIIILIVFVLIIAAGIIYVLPRQNDTENNNSSTSVNAKVIECDRNSDCLVGGCSNTLCLPRDLAPSVMTTCEWRDEYACFAQNTCGCVDHQCQWAGSEQYLDCVNKLL